MTIPNNNLSWLVEEDKLTGSPKGSPTLPAGNLNEPLAELLLNDQDLQSQITAIGGGGASTFAGLTDTPGTIGNGIVTGNGSALSFSPIGTGVATGNGSSLSFSPAQSAHNKPFGATAGTVAMGDHSHPHYENSHTFGHKSDFFATNSKIYTHSAGLQHILDIGGINSQLCSPHLTLSSLTPLGSPVNLYAKFVISWFWNFCWVRPIEYELVNSAAHPTAEIRFLVHSTSDYATFIFSFNEIVNGVQKSSSVPGGSTLLEKIGVWVQFSDVNSAPGTTFSAKFEEMGLSNTTPSSTSANINFIV